MIAYRVVIFCDGDCGSRYLTVASHVDLAGVPSLVPPLIEKARHDGWTVDGDGHSHWCPVCVRSLRAEVVAAPASVRAAKDGGLVGKAGAR